MINGTKLKILGSFFPEGKEITLNKITERTGLSYEPVHRIIKQLVSKNLISEKKIGKTLIYNLDFKKEETELAFFFYSKQKIINFSKKYGKIFRAISKIDEEHIDFLAIFGSYAKGNPTKQSDVDIICVSSKKNKTENELKGLRYETNLEFIPVVMSKAEFSKIKKENEVFWKDLIKYGIIFKGYELFYYYTYLR